MRDPFRFLSFRMNLTPGASVSDSAYKRPPFAPKPPGNFKMDLSAENIRNAADHASDIANHYLEGCVLADMHTIAGMLRELASLEAENVFLKTIIKAQREITNEQTNSERPKDGQTVKT